MANFPHMKKPCKACPFRKDTTLHPLGKRMAVRICNATSFVCHNKRTHQCAGHMLLRGSDNVYVNTAKKLDIDLSLSGRELVFNSMGECIKHHERKY